MPVSGYHYIRHPETGETILVPDLSSRSIDSTKQEMEGWISSSKIPEELVIRYINDINNKNDMLEQIKRGEMPILPTGSVPIDTSSISFTEYLLSNKATLYEENVLIKMFSKLDDKDPDIVWLKFVRDAIHSISSQDPLHFHFYAARKVLKEKFSIEDSRAVDILSRELVEHCKIISTVFKSFKHPAFKKSPIDFADMNDHLSDDKIDILQIDLDFIEYLNRLGLNGKKLASKVEKNSAELFKFYKDKEYSHEIRRHVWGLWVPSPVNSETDDKDNKELLSPFIQLLCQVLWEDRCINLWSRQSKQVPAITKPVVELFKPILSTTNKKTIVQQDDQIVCLDQDGAALFSAPVMDPKMIKLFQGGVKSLGSLTGHKLLRWEIKKGYEKWAQGEEDWRLIKIDGGFSKIAELADCNSEHDISKIKEILYTQAHGLFAFPDGSRGNMLILRVEDRYRNSEPSKISIVLGDMLLPGYVHGLKGREQRLIPIGDLPPLHGSKNTHAFQAQLQLIVFEEFSNQSKRIAELGAALIPIDRWKDMAHEAGLNPDKVDVILSHWCRPDLFNCFLDRQGDEYCLANYHERAQKFLVHQGLQRIANSERGKTSTAITHKKGKEK